MPKTYHIGPKINPAASLLVNQTEIHSSALLHIVVHCKAETLKRCINPWQYCTIIFLLPENGWQHCSSCSKITQQCYPCGQGRFRRTWSLKKPNPTFLLWPVIHFSNLCCLQQAVLSSCPSPSNCPFVPRNSRKASQSFRNNFIISNWTRWSLWRHTPHPFILPNGRTYCIIY